MALSAFLLLLVVAYQIHAATLQVSAKGANATSPLQYGLIFEDISHSGDGGIYAELIQNRAFQAVNFTSASVEPWTAVGGAALTLSHGAKPLSKALPFSINVAPPAGSSKKVGIANPGYWGIAVTPQTYTGSFYVKGTYQGLIQASLESAGASQTFAMKAIKVASTSTRWTQYNFTLTPTTKAPTVNNTLTLLFNPKDATDGSLNFNLISLFPPTYNNRPNGMRVELMQALAATTPSFLRMPGGNNLEGNGLAEYSPAWNWSETVGPLINRPGRLGAWGYYNTDGLGLNEYFEWCQDLHMEPLLAVWDGHYLDGTIISKKDLQFYVQDTLNELEYLLGSKDTTYGAKRMADGYPQPWSLRYLEIGNEDNLSSGEESVSLVTLHEFLLMEYSSYVEYRFQAYYRAIHAAYPDLNIIASTSEINVPAGESADYHQYTRPDDFVLQFDYFDQNSTDTQTLVGEYACLQPNDGVPTDGANFDQPRPAFPFWIGTVSEAVFLLGTERNNNKILGACYAPILQNLNNYQWLPNLISFTADPAQTVLSTSYQLVTLFSNTRFTKSLPVTSSTGFGPLYYAAGVNSGTGSHIFKAAVYNSTADVPIKLSFAGSESRSANLTVLTAPNGYSNADIGYNPVVQNSSTLIANKAGVFSFSLPNLSIAVLATN